MANLRTKDGANQDRYIKSIGSGTDADPTIVAHYLLSDTGESGLIQAALSALRITTVNTPEIRQATASALNATIVGAVEARQSNASALRGTMEVYQAAPSALRGTMEIYQATASALQVTATQSPTASGWTARIVTPSGDTAMDTGLSAIRTYLVGGSVVAVEVRQSLASALRATAEIYQSTASALNATVTGTVSVSANNLSVRLQDGVGNLIQSGASDPVNTDRALVVRNIPSGSQAVTLALGTEVRQSNASALRVTAEVYQSSPSALRATAEVYQATASAFNATVTQNPTASGWTTRVVTSSGDTAMDSANSALRVNLVAGGAGNGNLQDGLQSNLAATVKGYASGSPLMVALTDSAGAHIPSLDVKQTTASALNATVSQAANASGWTARLVTPSGDTAMDTSNSALRVNLVAGGAGNGNIQDGVQSNLAATVKGYPSASPLTVRLSDTNGDYVAAGAGTQYTEDDAAAANPVGGQLVARRRDALASEVTTDGDVIALNATSVGELYVRHIAAIPVTDNGGILTVDGTVNASISNLSVRLQDGNGLLVQSGASDPVNTAQALLVRNIPSGSQAVTGSVGITGVVDVKQTTASALNATVTIPGVVDVKQTTASALQATVTQNTALSGWTTRLVTPSGDTAMDTGLSAIRAYLIGGSNGAVEARQSNASALQVTAEVRQATASALNVTVNGFVEVRQGLGSALHVKAEVAQANASALRMTGEVYQSLASALNAQTVGELAHDAVDSGNPIKFGGKALEASPTNVAHLDRANAYFDKAGRQFVRHGGQAQDFWSATCVPGNGNVRAVVTRTNTASGTRLVVTGLTATMVSGSGAPAASMITVQLVSGASLWAMTLGVPASAGLTAGINRTGLWIPSPQASGMSIEFLSAGGVNVLQSVSMEGTTIAE